MLIAHVDEMLLVAEKPRTGHGDTSESFAQSKLDKQRDGGRMFLGQEDGA